MGDVRASHNVLVDHDIEVKGDIRLTNGDCAEDFDITGAMAVEPGTVMVSPTRTIWRQAAAPTTGPTQGR